MSADRPNRPGMVDWDLAVRVGSRLVGEGPQVSRGEAVEAVEELRAGAERSTPLVREFTGLVASERTAPVLVVDRPGWVQANADGFATVIAPLIDKLQEKKGAPGPLTEAIGSRITGVELGAMLGFLGSKVLGQFDPFHEKPGEQGRLLLVAPNIVHVERELQADPHDFRLWVCLHEETHRVQFTAVPWMTDHLRSEMGSIVGAVQTDPSELLGDAVRKIGDLVSGKSEGSLLDLFSSPEQKAVIERVTGVMSLLEGHADVVMDGVGPEVIPSVAEIRRKFTQRRKGVGGLDRLLRRLLGLDQKMAQYRDGAVFVRAAVDKVGMDGLQRRVGGAGQPAHQERDPRPGAVDRARPRLSRARWRSIPRWPRCGSPYAATSARTGATGSWSPARAAPTRWRCSPPASSRDARPESRSSASPSTTACRRARPSTRRGWSSRWRRSASTRPRRSG